MRTDRKPISPGFKEAIELYARGDIKAAQVKLLQLVNTERTNSEAIHLLGIIYYLQGKMDDSILYISQAIALEPDNEAFYTNLGNAQQMLGNFVDAEKSFIKSLELNKNNVEARFNLANLKLISQKLVEAKILYEQVIELVPEHVDANQNLAVVFERMGLWDEALEIYNFLLSLNPKDTRALTNKGQILIKKQQYEEAEEDLLTVLRIEPEHWAANNNLGIIYNNQDKILEATECFAKSLNTNPANGEACSNLLMNLYKLCNWNFVEAIRHRMDSITMANLDKNLKPGETPFLNLFRVYDQSLSYRLAKSWSDYYAENQPLRRSFNYQPMQDDVIKIGYISCDFYDHATTHLIMRLFELHDRTKFKIYVYSYGPKIDDKYRNKVVRDSDVFLNIANHSNFAAAETINNDGIDILIDLKGYTKNHRMGICALRPAPIQIAYLGFPGTTGASFFDYVIVDEIVCPPETQQFYAEKFIYMPNTYQITDNQQKIASTGTTRKDHNLPEDAFVLCCFNQSCKYEPDIYAVWLRVLLEFPNTVLWLWEFHERTTENLHAMAEQNGVNPARIIMASKMKKSEHLERLQLADLMVDTKHYNGHTTTTDALWAGIPIVTILGQHFASRVSASLLTAVGLEECIGNDIYAYEAIIKKFVMDKDFYLQIHERLEENIKTKPLFNSEEFVKALEARLLKVVDQYRQGLSPTPVLAITESE